MMGLAGTLFQFDIVTFSLGFIVTELVARYFPRLRLFVFNGKKKIKIHHVYLGMVGAFLSAISGQVALLNISLGTMANDIVYHARKRMLKFLKKSR